MFKDIGTIPYHRQRWQDFKDGTLIDEWMTRYPHLFDGEDLRLARSQGHLGAQFYCWFSAVYLHEATGYRSLVEKYQFKAHKKKREIVAQVLAEPVRSMVLDRKVRDGAICPDLLMYKADMSDWFFCEVKGPTDTLRTKQRVFFEELASASGKPVYLLNLVEIGL